MSSVRSISSDKYNYGLGVLRIVMCFEVIFAHFLDASVKSPGSWMGGICGYAASTFLLMSFYLTAKVFTQVDVNKEKKRLKKLVTPLIVWPFIYFVIYKLSDAVFKSSFAPTIKDLVVQIVFGHSLKLNSVLWFQWVIIILNIVFLGIFVVLDKKKAIIAISSLAIISLLLQYSGIWFSTISTLPLDIQIPVGRLVESVPVAVIGILLYEYGFYSKISDRLNSAVSKFIASVGMLLLLVVIFYSNLIPEASGFGYQGIKKILMSLLFFSLPQIAMLEGVSEGIKSAILALSKYTMGIYCCHVLVGNIIEKVFGRLGITLLPLMNCFTIFIGSYILCFLISRIPFKWCQDLTT